MPKSIDKESHSHTPSTPITVLQWNVQGTKSHQKKAYIQALLATILPSQDVICLQETHLRQNDVFSLPGYQAPIYGQTTETHHNGILTMVKKGIIATHRETPDMGNIEV